MGRAAQAERFALTGFCGYEIAALHTRLPTITALSWRYRHRWQGKAAIAAALAFLTYHLYFEGLT